VPFALPIARRKKLFTEKSIEMNFNGGTFYEMNFCRAFSSPAYRIFFRVD